MHTAREEDGVAYMTQFDQVDMMGIEFPPYEEPPPPYTPPKPPEYTNGDAPPPYTPENNNNEGEGRMPVRPGMIVVKIKIIVLNVSCDFKALIYILDSTVLSPVHTERLRLAITFHIER